VKNVFGGGGGPWIGRVDGGQFIGMKRGVRGDPVGCAALVLFEFADLAAAERWYEAEVDQGAKRLRVAAARLRIVAMQGVD
jgi:uncharacterized protein (DUF1330 family)